MAVAGRVIVVFGTKGGIGKTVVAVNLASSLSAIAGRSVALLDLDVLGVGDVAKMLRANPQLVLADLPSTSSPTPGTEASLDLSQLLIPVGNLQVVAAVRNPQQASLVTSALVGRVIAKLRSQFAYVIVDGGRLFTDALTACFDQANLILLVVGPDIVTLTQSKWALETMGSLLLPIKMVKTIVNRAGSRGGVSTEDVRSALGCEALAEIPSDGRAVTTAVNQGVPLNFSQPNTKITEAFIRLAEQLTIRGNLYVEQRASPTERATTPGGGTSQVWSSSLPAAEASARGEFTDEHLQLKRRLHTQLLDRLDLRKLDLAALTNPSHMADLRRKTERTVVDLLATEVGGLVPSHEARAKLVKEIVDEALGLGPLEDLLADGEVTDILVNTKDQIYVERHGKLELTPRRFISDDQLRTIIERIVAPLGRRIDEANPMVDARLADGSRVNAIIPPLAIKGPTLSIRKFARTRYTQDDLVRFDSLTPGMAQFIRACVIARKNMIVSGGTGSGKTTTLNIISAFIPEGDRIITIEDAAELRLAQPHWVSLESRPPNVEGRGQITIRDLFRNVLRMRPDRIIIGECRGGETLDMLQAMNTGHDGSLTTVHANSPRDVISRLDSLVLMSGIELPIRAIREMVVSAVDVIIHTARLSDGSRKVTSISEILKLSNESDVMLQDLFLFRQTGVGADGKVQGVFVSTGHQPTFLDELMTKGLELPPALFEASEAHAR